MGDRLDEPEFWLPAEFLTDEDVFMEKNNFNQKESNSSLCFPTEFPYDFDSYVSSPVLSSNETESDEEESLAELTRQLTRSAIHETNTPTHSQNHFEKNGVLLGSPQSTLTHAGSWSGRSTSSSGSPNGPSQVSSPPTTPLGYTNNAWDLIYEAAGQVSRMKLSGHNGPPTNLGPHVPSRSFTPVNTVKRLNNGFYSGNVQQVKGIMWNGQVKNGWAWEEGTSRNTDSRAEASKYVEDDRHRGAAQGRFCQAPWPIQNQNLQQQYSGSGKRAVLLGVPGSGAGVKRQCAGTGVFLPRRYGNNNSSDSRKKSGGSTAFVPTRVVQALNSNLNDLNSLSQPRFNASFISDYDILVARRNALLAQQRWNLRAEEVINREIRLPREWTY